jgi:hypothetical protein
MSTGSRLLLAHLAGDYLLQPHWMSQEKTTRWSVAATHGVIYGVAHLLVTRSLWRLAVIAGTHAVIDRYRLAKHISWAKNQIGPARIRQPWQECEATGYPPETPPWLAVWLMIIVDNTMHLFINAAVTDNWRSSNANATR